MVTGIETAGLILAILPLIISALESYKKGLRPFKTFLRDWRIELENLIRCLKDQKVYFRINLHLFLKSAAPDENAEMLSEEYSVFLQDDRLKKQIDQYLFVKGASGFFSDTLGAYDASMKAIVAKLGHIERPATASPFQAVPV